MGKQNQKTGNPSDGTKKIADRQVAELGAKERAKRERRAREAAAEKRAIEGGPMTPMMNDVAPVIPFEEFPCNMFTGQRVYTPDGSLYEMNSKGGLMLTSSTNPVLKDLVSVAKDVFILPWQIVYPDFKSTLKYQYGKKQKAMWEEIGNAIGDDGLLALHERIEVDKVKSRYVGENAEVWRTNIVDPASAFKSMTPAKPAVFQLGATSEVGLVLECTWNDGLGAMMVGVGHVGAKHPLTEKIVKGAFIKCYAGQLPDEVRGTNIMTASANELLQFITGTEYALKAVVVREMYLAAQRLTSETRTPKRPATLAVVGGTGMKPNKEPVVATTVAPASAPVQAPVPAPAPIAQPAPVANSPVATAGLSITDAVKVMMSAGVSTEEVFKLLLGGTDSKSA